MKHDRSHRRDVRRHADPSLICLPGPRPTAAPPRGEPEATTAPSSAIRILDDEALDAELLAHKNIFDAPPRMSRQARRKALRAEQKAARRAVTERFLTGAPSLGQAAAQYSVAAMPVALDHETPGEAMAEPEALVEAELMLAERPELTSTGEIDEVALVTVETHHKAMSALALLEPATTEEAEDPIALEDIAQLISATGPLIVENLDMAEEPVAKSATLPEIELVAAVERVADDMEGEPPAWLVQRATAAAAVPIEAMTTPLPRNRALVPAKRSWLMRVMSWPTPRRRGPAPQPALAELQDLRFELVGALQRLDQIIDRLA